MCMNDTTSAILHQIHLNFYTQYSYNKWHKVSEMCPLCNEPPESIYRILYHCRLVKTIWNDLSPILLDLHPCPITNEKKPGIRTRNWLTYTMRKCTSEIEEEAHYDNSNILRRAKRKIQSSIESELDQKVFMRNFSRTTKLYMKG